MDTTKVIRAGKFFLYTKNEEELEMKKVLSMIVCTMLMVIMAVPTTAYATSDVASAVSDARSGVLQIEMAYETESGAVYSLATGSSFLIGETSGAEYLITSAHVVVFDDATLSDVSDALGETVKASDLAVRVVVKRDVYIGATLVNYSEELDFAILKLDQPIYDREPLVLNSSDDNAVATQTVYALGFPIINQISQDVQLYTEEDVTVTTGIVSKKNQTDNVSTIHHSAELDYGNSGGPLLNTAGEVVGINKAVFETSNDTISVSEDNTSVDIAEVTQVLDMLGIQYISSEDGTTSVTTEDPTEDSTEVPTEDITEEPIIESVSKTSLEVAISAATPVTEDTSGYTDESVETFEAALATAETVNADADASQNEVDDATDALTKAQTNLEEVSGMNMMLIGGIIAAVVVIILIVVIILVVSQNKKKRAPVGSAPVPPTPARPVPPTPVSAPVPPTPTFGSEGDNPTTVLNSGAGETGVLGGSMMTATLIRTKNNENITINKQMFKIGKERAKVDYCIADNNSVSRVHVHIMGRNGAFYIVDQNATNFTFVNGTKIAPNQEVQLKTGDKIKVSDEEFEFRM